MIHPQPKMATYFYHFLNFLRDSRKIPTKGDFEEKWENGLNDLKCSGDDYDLDISNPNWFECWGPDDGSDLGADYVEEED